MTEDPNVTLARMSLPYNKMIFLWLIEKMSANNVGITKMDDIPWKCHAFPRLDEF